MKPRFFYNQETKGPQSQDPVHPEAGKEAKDLGNGLNSLDQEIVNARFGTEAQKRVLEFREAIDGFFLTAKRLQMRTSSRAWALAVTAFQSARHFTGVWLRELGSPSPYKETDNMTSKHIDPVANRGLVLQEITDQTDEVLAVKKFRDTVQNTITDIAVYIETHQPSGVIMYESQSAVITQVISGKMWLGERLGEIRDDSIKA
jgi:hypothetical protein